MQIERNELKSARQTLFSEIWTLFIAYFANSHIKPTLATEVSVVINRCPFVGGAKFLWGHFKPQIIELRKQMFFGVVYSKVHGYIAAEGWSICRVSDRFGQESDFLGKGNGGQRLGLRVTQPLGETSLLTAKLAAVTSMVYSHVASCLPYHGIIVLYRNSLLVVAFIIIGLAAHAASKSSGVNMCNNVICWGLRSTLVWDVRSHGISPANVIQPVFLTVVQYKHVDCLIAHAHVPYITSGTVQYNPITRNH